MKKIIFIFSFLLLLISQVWATSGEYFGDIQCEAQTQCVLIQSKGALSEKRFVLLTRDAKRNFKGGSYNNNFVKIIGVEGKNGLRVFGISLSIPDERLMRETESL